MSDGVIKRISDIKKDDFMRGEKLAYKIHKIIVISQIK